MTTNRVTPDQVFTPEEAAAIVKLPVKTVRELCARGEIPGARKMGRRWRIPAWFVDQLFVAPTTRATAAADDADEPVAAATSEARERPTSRRAGKRARDEFLAFARELDKSKAASRGTQGKR